MRLKYYAIVTSLFVTIYFNHFTSFISTSLLTENDLFRTHSCPFESNIWSLRKCRAINSAYGRTYSIRVTYYRVAIFFLATLMDMILRYARHRIYWLSPNQIPRTVNGALPLSLQFASFAIVILVIIITKLVNDAIIRRQHSRLSQSRRWLAATATLVLSSNTFHVRARDNARRCVNAYARAQERTCARESLDSSLPLTINKCSVSMWKYAVTKERIFHFVICRRAALSFFSRAARGPF